jgi:hypothetical protein
VLLALALGCSVSTTGCLVADAPNYGPPEQRPPVIDSQGVLPNLYALIVIPEDSVGFEIRVPVRSEDAGEQLRGVLYVDYNLENEVFWDDQPIPAGSFDELNRSWDTSFQTDPRLRPGCRTLTAFITHSSNFDGRENVIIDFSDFDVASVTWWMNVNPTTPSMPGSLEGCPTPMGAP